mmetsp:Transcript_50154/g.80948  ORF Transcript_50154/g.80948 Transcript_50154/m.80948 type:complete len:200 (-) Transcript_50154:1235-1834(-)
MSWLLAVRRHAVVRRVRLRVLPSLPTIGLLLVVRHLLHLVYVLHLPLLHHILLMKGLHHSSIRIYHAHSVVGLLVLVRQNTQRIAKIPALVGSLLVRLETACGLLGKGQVFVEFACRDMLLQILTQGCPGASIRGLLAGGWCILFAGGCTRCLSICRDETTRQRAQVDGHFNRTAGGDSDVRQRREAFNVLSCCQFQHA